jgi:hypothetical protein
LLEVGAAVLHGVPVFWVGHTVSSVIHHPLVRTCSTLDEAFEAIRAL